MTEHSKAITTVEDDSEREQRAKNININGAGHIADKLCEKNLVHVQARSFQRESRIILSDKGAVKNAYGEIFAVALMWLSILLGTPLVIYMVLSRLQVDGFLLLLSFGYLEVWFVSKLVLFTDEVFSNYKTTINSYNNGKTYINIDAYIPPKLLERSVKTQLKQYGVNSVISLNGAALSENIKEIFNVHDGKAEFKHMLHKDEEDIFNEEFIAEMNGETETGGDDYRTTRSRRLLGYSAVKKTASTPSTLNHSAAVNVEKTQLESELRKLQKMVSKLEDGTPAVDLLADVLKLHDVTGGFTAVQLVSYNAVVHELYDTVKLQRRLQKEPFEPTVEELEQIEASYRALHLPVKQLKDEYVSGRGDLLQKHRSYIEEKYVMNELGL